MEQSKIIDTLETYQVRAKIFPLPIDVLTPRCESKLHDEQHKGRKVYTDLVHRCGVIPYSSVWWWIASRADGEQYKGRTASREVFLSWCDELLG